MIRSTLGAALSAIAVLFELYAPAAIAQELIHPREMKFPESRFERPNPADYQLILENGLAVYIAAADQVPMVTLSAFARAGRVSDDQQGAAEVLLDALRLSGPADRSPEAFRKTLIEMTADYSVVMHDEWTEISLNVPKEDLDEALALFAAVVRSPAVTDANLARTAKKTGPGDSSDLAGEDGLALYEGSLAAAAERFHEILYADHPYGYKPVVDDFSSLTVANVQAFHREFFVPGNMTLAIAGDIDTREIVTAVARLFADMDALPVPPVEPVPAIAEMRREQHVFPARKLQSWLVFGHDLPETSPDDQAALEVMNYILAGGHLWTRMTIETRYRYGYTNDASGFLEDHWSGPGSYTFRSYSRPEVIGAVYDNMMAEIDRIQNEPVTDEELFVARGALTDGSFQVRYLDGYAIARDFALEKLRYGNHSRSASYVSRVRSVTTEDVLAAANRFIRPENMQIVLVGDPVALIRQQ